MRIRTPAEILQPAIVLLGVIACVILGRTSHSVPAAVTPTPIAQVPLTVATAAHPQIVIAVGNSQSMDGNLSGAIMTGSGALNPTLTLLQASSSPVNFTIPGGFVPPLNAGAGGVAPYTVAANGVLVDNSPSRLNVAKQGIAAVLNAFLPNADFALFDYVLTGTGVHNTWLYEMSPTTGPFVFSNTITPPPDRWVANPCYQYHTLGNGTVLWNDCHAIDISNKVTGNMDQAQFMQISASSDDPLINDVLYTNSGIDAVCLDYGGVNPANPYVAYTLGQYNASPSNISESYVRQANICPPTTFPTNAGYVPFTPQTLYIRRGFGYYGGQSATSANTLVPMTSAGANPTAASVNTALAAFTPYLAPETSSPGSAEIKAAGGQSALAGLLHGTRQYYKTANPPSTNGCAAQRYVILLTDGLPTLDLGGGSWPPPGTVSAQQWGMRVAFNADGSLDTSSNTNDQAVLDTVSELTQLQKQGINTYVIGLGAGVDPSVNPVAAQVLTAFAIAGGTGTYFAATSAVALTNDLQSIVARIIAATQSTASTGVNSTGLHSGSVAYLAQFTTSDNYQDWTGNLNAWPINPSTGQVDTTAGNQLWSAQAQLDAQGANARLIVTWDPLAKSGTPFRWSPPPATQGISATTALGQALGSFGPDPNGQDVLQYLRGSNAQEQRNGGPFRNRTHKLGDIVFSGPLYVGAPNGLAQTPDYFAFVTAHAQRAPVVYVGANDGMLHAFDAATGAERFAYVPNGVFNNLVKLANPYYNQQHQYFVNGSPRVADVKFASDGSWHTVLVGTEGAGGSTLFALDVSAPDSLLTEAQVAQAVLWEFTDPDMGLSFSEPEIVTTAAGWMVVVGNGYNSPHQKPVLYGLDPQTGAILAKIDLCAAVPTACNTAVANGLSSVAVVNSYGQVSAAANVAYAGDLQGNVWRVDITDANPANWIVSVMFQATDPGGAPQPITTVPAVTLNPKFPNLLGTMVYVGTGQLLGIPDLSTTQTQTLYGIYDPPTGATPPIGFAGVPHRVNLQAQVLAMESVNGSSVRTVPTPSAVPLPPTAGAVRGWYMDLSLDPGERVVTDPEIEAGGGVVFTTYQPSSSVCSGGGSAWLMVLNFATGAAFPLPELDVTGDGKLNQGDVPASGNVPVGMLLGSVYASTPTLLPGGGALGGTSKLTSLSNGTVDSVLDRGRAKRRISWWEVRH
ncbi:MAG: pilus assembly protein PilY [Gammaproteobacteria bacterium]|nr:pilus assembly protein PilY [Gammaproteobacteria bacterium]